jgi:hypothetical protein
MTTAIQVISRPILFSGPMVKAILDGRKGMTRRVVKPQPKATPYGFSFPGQGIKIQGERDSWILLDNEKHQRWIERCCPYGVPGDRLWVRESFLPCKGIGDRYPVQIDLASYVCFRDGSQKFRSGGSYYQEPPREGPLSWPSDVVWRPSIHMPRWASRLTLEITAVRVERLNAISEADAIAEGLRPWTHRTEGAITARRQFVELWDTINDKRPGCSWESNPWVWVIAFRRLGIGAER